MRTKILLKIKQNTERRHVANVQGFRAKYLQNPEVKWMLWMQFLKTNLKCVWEGNPRSPNHKVRRSAHLKCPYWQDAASLTHRLYRLWKGKCGHRARWKVTRRWACWWAACHQMASPCCAPSLRLHFSNPFPIQQPEWPFAKENRSCHHLLKRLQRLPISLKVCQDKPWKSPTKVHAIVQQKIVRIKRQRTNWEMCFL